MSIPAIFLDRDGTINVDHGYVHEIVQFEFIDGVIEACRTLNEMGFALFVITNQSGIARGYFDEAQFLTLTEWMKAIFAKHDVIISGVYYCPHHADDQCDCRKPKPGMLQQAQKEFDIDLSRSFMVGDKLDDILAGKAAGVKTVLVKSGKAITNAVIAQADFVIESVAMLPKMIKNNMQKQLK